MVVTAGSLSMQSNYNGPVWGWIIDVLFGADVCWKTYLPGVPSVVYHGGERGESEAWLPMLSAVMMMPVWACQRREHWELDPTLVAAQISFRLCPRSIPGRGMVPSIRHSPNCLRLSVRPAVSGSSHALWLLAALSSKINDGVKSSLGTTGCCQGAKKKPQQNKPHKFYKEENNIKDKPVR